MTNIELILNMLAEASTTEISKVKNPDGFNESRDVAKGGGNIAGNARKELEDATGRKVVSKKNSKTPELLDENLYSLKNVLTFIHYEIHIICHHLKKEYL